MLRCCFGSNSGAIYARGVSGWILLHDLADHDGAVGAGLRKIANGHVLPSTKSLSLLFEASKLKAASEQVNASDRSYCLKVLSASVVEARHPEAASAL